MARFYNISNHSTSSLRSSLLLPRLTRQNSLSTRIRRLLSLNLKFFARLKPSLFTSHSRRLRGSRYNGAVTSIISSPPGIQKLALGISIFLFLRAIDKFLAIIKTVFARILQQPVRSRTLLLTKNVAIGSNYEGPGVWC